MHEITMQDTQDVSGSWSLLNYVISQLVTASLQAAASGQVDYSSVAEQQGHYYNTVGA